MSTLVTKEAPEFAAQAVLPDNSFAELTLSSYRGKYVVLFFYPLDFTFVCPSEIIAFDKGLAKFESKNAQVIGVSVDSLELHERFAGELGLPFALIADTNGEIARAYGVAVHCGRATRATFVIDKAGTIRRLDYGVMIAPQLIEIQQTLNTLLGEEVKGAREAANASRSG